MRCSELVEELKKLKRSIEFYSGKAKEQGRVAKKLYGGNMAEPFFEGLAERYGHILPRENWIYIYVLIQELADPQTDLLTELPISKEFIDKL